MSRAEGLVSSTGDDADPQFRIVLKLVESLRHLYACRRMQGVERLWAVHRYNHQSAVTLDLNMFGHFISFPGGLRQHQTILIDDGEAAVDDQQVAVNSLRRGAREKKRRLRNVFGMGPARQRGATLIGPAEFWIVLCGNLHLEIGRAHV